MYSFLKLIRKLFGYNKDSAETFDRLIHSKHVGDLRGIALVTVGAAIFAIVGLSITAATARMSPYEIIVSIGAVFAGIGGIIAWCYQTGSGRLGIVDLFACEITTLCRICTVTGLADTCIEAFELDASGNQPPDDGKIKRVREAFSHFDSSETYTPVFDANAKDLQPLSVKVVTNITAYYTFWKATQDAFRKLAHTDPPVVAGVEPASDKSNPWHQAMRNVVYMQFLAYESARKSVRGLIEFEPNKAENTIMILLSELRAYGFLLKYVGKEDVRYKRLILRQSRYRDAVGEVYYHSEDEYVKHHSHDKYRKRLWRPAPKDPEELRRDWAKVHGMLDELKKIYESAIGEFPSRREVNRVKGNAPS
jgi:hypothetical protein